MMSKIISHKHKRQAPVFLRPFLYLSNLIRVEFCLGSYSPP